MNGKRLAQIISLLVIGFCTTGCPKPQPPSANSLPAATQAASNAVTNIGNAATQAAVARQKVTAAQPLTTQPATGYLVDAGTAIDWTLTDLASAKSDAADAVLALSGAQQERTQMAAALAQAQTDADKATAGVKYWKDKYQGQWFAGKTWAAIYTVGIGMIVLFLITLAVNAKFDIFVTIWNFIEVPVKALFGLLGQAFAGFVNLFKPKPPTPPAP